MRYNTAYYTPFTLLRLQLLALSIFATCGVRNVFNVSKLAVEGLGLGVTNDNAIFEDLGACGNKNVVAKEGRKSIC